MRTLAHIINPVKVDKSSALFVAPPITFETMENAREVARVQVDVTLFSANYAEDASFVTKVFQLTPNLDRSVLDFGSFQEQRKLPLLRDILSRLYEASNAEYFIYTNVDIAVMPYFYIAVNSLIDASYDAFVINRRTISDRFQSINEIPLMLAEVGKSHPGHDCFVFKREAYSKYNLANVCIGMPPVGRVLIWNLMCHAQNFREFKKKHLTFHLGDDRNWVSDKYSDYFDYNINEGLKVWKALDKEYGPFDDNAPRFLYPPIKVNGKAGPNKVRRLFERLHQYGYKKRKTLTERRTNE